MVSPSRFHRAEDCRVEDLAQIVDAGADQTAAHCPGADRLESGVPIYDSATLRERLGDPRQRQAIQAELADVLERGPGVAVFTGAFTPSVVEPVTRAFEAIIAAEKQSGRVAGDHFAAPGANDRVWNALEKLAVLDPGAFVDYYANDILDLVSTAWLGPGYQVTSQVNVVNPGGAGQTVHRDYHLGFLGPQASTAYPTHVHAMSALLTLQGAVAHVDMAVASGPTLFLPHSQKYDAGYVAYHRPDFQDFFAQRHLQLPLALGDAVFFNPALLHAAGTNRTGDVRRMANLLQISSAFGRAMEVVDRRRVVEAVYPSLQSRRAAGVDPHLLACALAASAEGYPFPTNLDVDQPVDGMAPPSQAAVVAAALAEGADPAELGRRLGEHARARLTS